ncbi:iron ABC transporter permease [Treponema sp. OttesenSCG-928-L16]|nr:iron ABC transporter permease [Treponema sp. OttesenSCG-928-L16]
MSGPPQRAEAGDEDCGSMKRAYRIMGLIPLAFILAAFVLPYGAALSQGLAAGHGAEVFSGEQLGSLWRVLIFTLSQAFFSMLLALALGLPGAWLLGSGSFKGRRLMKALSSIPFAMPSILVVLGFVLFLGNSGWLNNLILMVQGKSPESAAPLSILYKPSAIILAHGFYNFPLVMRLTGDGIRDARRLYAPAAASLGASPFKTALTVLFPVILPSLAAACLLAFLYSFTSFAVVLVLGGGPGATTLPVEIYRYARISLDYRSAGILALLETIIAAIVFVAYLYFERKARAYGGEKSGRTQGSFQAEAIGRPLSKIWGGLYGFCMLILVLGPLLSIPAESFLYRPTRSALPAFSLHHWAALGGRVIPALIRSLILAALAASFSLVLALLAAWAARMSEKKSAFHTLIRALSAAPLASSGIVLGLGWLILYGRDHSRTLLAVILVHGISALPFAFNSIYEGFASISGNTINAAAAAGAGPVKTLLTVAMPISLGRLRSAWGFAAAISLGELNALFMLGFDSWETLPLLIYRAVGAYRFGTACAAGSLLLLCSTGAFLLSDSSFFRKVQDAD